MRFRGGFIDAAEPRVSSNVVPVERIELPTFGLQNRCSTAELNRHLVDVSISYEYRLMNILATLAPSWPNR